MILQLQGREIVAEDLGICIVSVTVGAFASVFGARSAVLLAFSRRRRRRLLVAVLLEFLSQAADEIVHLALCLQETLLDIIPNDGEVVYRISMYLQVLYRCIPSMKLLSRSSYSSLGLRPVSARRWGSRGGSCPR